ncbi:hypothetical protein BTO32_01700 [Marinobacter lutaoensis]|uniref:DUF2489 domain-containing protein n=1 Tax=Marinobacter lutaoensis TaxID=135739 RepID=A0A1V2DX26_9GAMM|nr:hypothetical protein [Marinobacter lutaoensis]ONF45212.1 hypothetical protein BTO32_01700 [Marinobacter lutaoensis]
MDRIFTNESELKRYASKAIELAGSLLESDADYLENVLELNSIGNRLVGEVWETEFHVFGVIASDTDHLPTKRVRPLCSATMLEKSDDELREIISSYRTEVSDACRRILSKYQNV